jgi:hypothetical protein
MEKVTAPQTSEIFVDIAMEIEELAKRLAKTSGVKPHEVLLLVAKVLEEEYSAKGSNGK